jgi:hypothetical protein
VGVIDQSIQYAFHSSVRIGSSVRSVSSSIRVGVKNSPCGACTRDCSCDAYCETVHSIASSYTRSSLDRWVQSDRLVQSATLGSVTLLFCRRTSMIVEVRAAGLLLPVAWESGGIPWIPSCGNSVATMRCLVDSCSNVLLTLLLLLLLMCHSCCAEQSLLQHLPSALAGGPCL